jgi:hypothetical protein
LLDLNQVFAEKRIVSIATPSLQAKRKSASPIRKDFAKMGLCVVSNIQNSMPYPEEENTNKSQLASREASSIFF